MKVLFLITRGDELGGAQTHVKDVILGLKQKYGIDCILATGSKGIFTDMMENAGIETHLLNSMKRDIGISDIRGLCEVRKLVKNINPDIISCHSSKAGVIGRLACVNLNVKKVFTAHGWAFTDGISKKKADFYRVIERNLSYITDAIINVSEFDYQLAKSAGIKSDHYVVHNCIPNKTLKRDVQRGEHSPISLVMVARFCEQKDHVTLLNALARIDKKLWRLKLVGGGDSSEIESLSKEMEIDENISFMGQVTNIQEILDDSDIFLLISNWEGFPISIIEAMRAGMPVIASSVGGVPEAIVHGQNGYLVQKKNVQELETCLLSLLQYPAEISRMGQVGCNMYQEKFNVDIMIDKYFKIFSGGMV